MRDFRLGDSLVGFELVMARVLGERGQAAMMSRIRLERMWPEVVGDALARQTWPESVRDGKLTIVVPNPTWNATLRSMERRILQIVQERHPELGVESLRIMLGRPRPAGPEAAAEPAEPGERELSQVILTAATRRQLEEVAAQIDDEPLRHSFLAAMTRHQQLRQWRLGHGWRICPETGELLPPEPAAAA